MKNTRSGDNSIFGKPEINPKSVPVVTNRIGNGIRTRLATNDKTAMVASNSNMITNSFIGFSDFYHDWLIDWLVLFVDYCCIDIQSVVNSFLAVSRMNVTKTVYSRR